MYPIHHTSAGSCAATAGDFLELNYAYIQFQRFKFQALKNEPMSARTKQISTHTRYNGNADGEQLHTKHTMIFRFLFTLIFSDS